MHPASQGVVLIREWTWGCGTDERPQFLSPPPASALAREGEGLTARRWSSRSLVAKSPRTDDLPGLALPSLAPIFCCKAPPGHEGGAKPPSILLCMIVVPQRLFWQPAGCFSCPTHSNISPFLSSTSPQIPLSARLRWHLFPNRPSKAVVGLFYFLQGQSSLPTSSQPRPALAPTHAPPALMGLLCRYRPPKAAAGLSSPASSCTSRQQQVTAPRPLGVMLTGPVCPGGPDSGRGTGPIPLPDPAGSEPRASPSPLSVTPCRHQPESLGRLLVAWVSPRVPWRKRMKARSSG